ncbi:MAG: hypothetical protein HY321_05455 [Armatimonadetes bacterium]|nr:hypothetical protein [Armatimonadota bacterium]
MRARRSTRPAHAVILVLAVAAAGLAGDAPRRSPAGGAASVSPARERAQTSDSDRTLPYAPFDPEVEEPAPPEPPDGDTVPPEDWGRTDGQGWYPPLRREPPPIPPARPLPFYPPEPPPGDPPGSVVSAPPDFPGSAAGYLEIPVGETAALPSRGASGAVPRDATVARVVAVQPRRVQVRGLFPGRTLLDVESPEGTRVWLVRVR